MAESRDQTPTTTPPKQEGVPLDLFRANLKGNEALPQRYLGIYIELLATIFESADPVGRLTEYLDMLPSKDQKQKLATAATALHEKYEIQDQNGNTIKVTPESAGQLWRREQFRLLEVLRSMIAFYKSKPGLWEEQPNDERYEMLSYHIRTALAEDGALREDLQEVFQVLRTTLRSMEVEQETYKGKFKNRRRALAVELDPADPATMNYQEYGTYMKKIIIRRAGHVFDEKYKDNLELFGRRRWLLQCVDLGMGEAQT